MGTTNLQTRGIEVIPAVLVKTREALLDSISKVSPFVKTIHIDVMDNKFVPNITVGLEELKQIPQNLAYEFHWMVQNPEKWIRAISGPHIHIVHVETIHENWEEIKKAVAEAGGRLGLAISPDTSLAKMLPYVKDANRVLVMTVRPGFSGQSYIKDAEEKASFLRRKFPDLDIEVDGGITPETAASAARAGVNKIAAASAIFSSQNIKEAFEKLRKAVGAHAD